MTVDVTYTYTDEAGASHTVTEALADTFETPWSDHPDRHGQSFEVVRVIDDNNPDPADTDAENHPMFVVRFPDGFEATCYPEEVLASRWVGYPEGRVTA